MRLIRYKSSREFQFHALRELVGLQYGHPEARPLGDRFTAIVTCSSDALDDTGMIIDMEYLRTTVFAKLHLKNLGEVIKVNPTNENIARHIFDEVNRFILHIEAQDNVVLDSVTVKDGLENYATVFITGAAP